MYVGIIIIVFSMVVAHSPPKLCVAVNDHCLLCVCVCLSVCVCVVLCGHGSLQAAAALSQLAFVAVERHLLQG